jgi:hypothetical protein
MRYSYYDEHKDAKYKKHPAAGWSALYVCTAVVLCMRVLLCVRVHCCGAGEWGAGGLDRDMAAHHVSLLLCIPTVVCAYLSDDGTPLEEVMVRGHRDSLRLRLVFSGLFQGSCVHALCIYPSPFVSPCPSLTLSPCRVSCPAIYLALRLPDPLSLVFSEHCRLDLVYLAWPL